MLGCRWGTNLGGSFCESSWLRVDWKTCESIIPVYAQGNVRILVLFTCPERIWTFLVNPLTHRPYAFLAGIID